MRILFALLLALMPHAAAAQDPYGTLTPLLDIFNPANDTPGYDVVGIRCAGLYYAQDQWRQTNGGRGATRAQLAAGEISLQRAVQHRIGEGRDLTDATLTTEADLRRAVAAYLDRFARNSASGHPWRNDPTLRGDQNYCEVATG